MESSLHELGQPSGPAGELIGGMTATGAVLVGRRTAEQVDHTAQRALEAGVLDELMIHQIPVLFGGGLA